MAKRERIYQGPGVAIWLQGRTWWVDLYRRGERLRASLRTTDRGEAIMKAGKIVKALEAREGEIKQLAWLARLSVEDQKLYHTPFDPKNPGPDGCRFFPGTLPPNPASDRLEELALDGVQNEDFLRRTIRDEVEGALERREIAPASGSRPAAPVSWEKALEDFNKSKGPKIKPYSLKQIDRDVQDFFRSSKLKSVQDGTPALVDRWVSGLQAAGGSAKTAWNKRLSLSSFYRWAERVEGIVESNPVEKTEPPKVEKTDPEYLTRERLEQRMEKIRGKAWEWVAGLSGFCGLRLGEIKALDPKKDVDLPGRWIRARRTKNGKPRNIPILDQAVRYVHMIPKEGFHWRSDKEISKQMNRLGVGNLLLRHTLETHLRLNQVLPQAVGDFWLGHSAKIGGEHYAATWKPSEPPVRLTYYGLPLVPYGIPEVPPAVMRAYKG